MGFRFPYSFITELKQEAVREESDTDYLYTKFDILTQGIININYLDTISSSLSSLSMDIRNSADIMNLIREQLMQHRKQLSLTFNGVELIPGPIGPGTVDAANGPKPQFCEIKRMTNETFIITFRIIANYFENNKQVIPVENTPGSNVLSNRWTETVTIDKANYSVRIREGKFILRSDNVDGIIADTIRSQLAVVGVPEGFLRESSQYTQSPDGLSIAYRLTDKEVFKMPPSPAFEADGEYIETSVKGGKRIAEVRVRLRGDKFTDQAKLLTVCMGVAFSKIQSNPNDADIPLTGIPLQAVVMSKLYENEVEVKARTIISPSALVNQDGRQQGWWGFDTNSITFTPKSDNVTQSSAQPLYFDRGSAGLLLQAAAYWDATLNATLNPFTGQNSLGLAPGLAGANLELPGESTRATPFADNKLVAQQAVPSATVTIGAVIPTDQLADFNRGSPPQSFWTDYMIISKFESDKHVYMMPLTSPIPFNGVSAAFVQMASPTLLWIVDWTASKTEEQPDIPNSLDPSLSARNWVLLDEHYEPAAVYLMADGVTLMYRISGTFVYGNLSPSTVTVGDIVFPRPAYIDDVFDRTLPINFLKDGLI